VTFKEPKPQNWRNEVKLMKVIAFNGSPRKNWNTATLLGKALEGAASQGAETELINLYDLNFKGCISCFSCKLKGGPNYGKCALKDDLQPVLKKVESADAIILGSPVYFGEVTGIMRSFMERLLFPYVAYDAEHTILFNRKIKTGLIYTTNARERDFEQIGYEQLFGNATKLMARVFGESEKLYSTETYQFDDYSKYVASLFDAQSRAKRRREVFPEDCEKAYDMGARFAKKQAPAARVSD
jgi:multimeric flavodoxin WrbA